MQEMLYYLGVKAIIRNEAGDVLVLNTQRADGSTFWDLPGGRVNKGEAITETLLREVKEETGITDLLIGPHLGIQLTTVLVPISESEKAGLILSIYLCSVGNVTDIQTEDNMEYEWCAPQEAISRVTKLSPEMKQTILEAVAA